MRLHQLSATAFGPFVDTVSVDFDELSAGGVFLLTGDTGAGKTSVLDAVCFALYGEVPGDRHTAHHLRSDQADAATAPRVTLELTVGRRTFRFTRSPAWERPKKRGTGTTRVQAHVVVEELRDGTWTTLTNRLDEAGQLVTGLLGMTCAQFTQVAMLPQNRFQAFLRASSAERQAVLQRLFRTERFEAVERWLVERRLALHRDSQSCHERVAAVVNRFQEAAGTAVPEEWDVHDLAPRADDGSLLAWADGTRHRAAADASAKEEAFETAAGQLHQCPGAVGRRTRGRPAEGPGHQGASDPATARPHGRGRAAVAAAAGRPPPSRAGRPPRTTSRTGRTRPRRRRGGGRHAPRPGHRAAGHRGGCRRLRQDRRGGHAVCRAARGGRVLAAARGGAADRSGARHHAGS